jgi:ubiquitin-protein ligase
MTLRPNIQKKILREINEINQDSKTSGIYAHVEGENVQSLKVMIIGPDDSPYKGGFFLFKVNFPADFPFSPPAVSFITPKRHARCRIHPNLYQEGKVCLSILNTWGGNEWSPALTLEKIFLTIQGLLDSNPIANEPGQERYSKTSPQGEAYIKVALYRTLTVAVLDMFTHPDLPSKFHPVVKEYFLEHREDYLKQAEQLVSDQGREIACFHGSEHIDYISLKNQLKGKNF